MSSKFLTITPYLGVNDYLFSESQSVVKKKNGEAFKIEIDNIMKQVKETRTGIELIFIKKKLVDIVIKKRSKPLLMALISSMIPKLLTN